MRWRQKPGLPKLRRVTAQILVGPGIAGGAGKTAPAVFSFLAQVFSFGKGVRSAGAFLEALAQVEAVGGDHHRHDQSNAGEDHDDFQDFDVEVVSKSA